MPTSGLSLVGFMEQLQAITHLRYTCVPTDPSDNALTAVWQGAKAKLLAAQTARAGNPNIQQIADQAYIQNFIRIPWVTAALQFYRTPYHFLLVEIDPLLSFQPVVSLDRVNHHFRSLPRAVGTSDLLPLCLPTVQPNEEMYMSPVLTSSQSVLIKSRNTGINKSDWGVFPFELNGFRAWLAGMRFHFSSPFLHVVRFNGKCYLSNGYHRAVGAKRAGATHIPCIFRDVSDYDSVGIRNDGSTFTAKELESSLPPNPPTVGHFNANLACDVRLRNISKILHVT
jgi:hypothetical protein